MAKTLTCTQCSGTSFQQIGTGTFRCRHCGAIVYFDETPPRQGRRPVSAKLPEWLQRYRLPVYTAGALTVAALLAYIIVPGSHSGKETDHNSEAVSAPTKVTTAAEPEARVHSMTALPDSIGNVYFIGLYKNTGEVSIDTPRVEVHLFKNKQKVASSFGYAARKVLAAGDETPVRVLVQNAPPYDSFKTSTKPKAVTYQKPRPAMQFLSSEILPRKYGGYELKGNIKNISETTARYVQVIALVYGEGDQIIGMGSAYLAENTLSPGQNGLFQVNLYSVKSKPVRVQLDHTSLPN